MSGKKHVMKGYSTYTNIPAEPGGCNHEPKHQLVETNTISQVRAPTAGCEVPKDFAGSHSKAELLKEYVYSSPMSDSAIYAPKTHYETKHVVNYQNPSPSVTPINNHLFSSPSRGYFSEESIQTQSGLGLTSLRNVKNGNISGFNKSYQTAGPLVTHHPFTTKTNNTNEALGLEDSVYYSPRADPRQRGVLDELSNRPTPLEPQRRYAVPSFVAKPNDSRQNITNTRSAIHSLKNLKYGVGY